jgi:Ca2+-binding RTX toxin-like protein
MSSPNPSTESTMQVIEAQRQGEGALSFTLPVNPADISKIEAVDLDLLLTTADGQQFILPQGALLAMTQPDSAMRFANGEESLASDAIKRVGVLKPVENGSFRLAGLDMESLEAEPVQGSGFGLGQEIQDVVSKLDTSSQRMEQILQTLDQVTQASPVTKGDEPPPSTQTGVKRTTKLADPNPFASPTPGAPPKPENENVSSIKITETPRGLFGPTSQVISNVQAVDKIKTAANDGVEVLKPFDEVTIREMVPNDPLQLRVFGTQSVTLEPDGQVVNTLVMPGVFDAASVRFELPANVKLPPGFKIAGTTFNNGILTVPAESLKDLQLSIQWTAEPLGTEIKPFEFQVGVKFLNAQGAELEQGRAPITFTYGEFRDLNDVVQLDGNSNTKIFLSAHGYNYDVLGDIADNIIVTGHGNDKIDGGTGADTMRGGLGNDTYVVDNTADVVTENLNEGTDTIEASVTYALSANVENLTLTGTTAINGTGNELNNVIIGNNGDNRLNGGAGADTLRGGLGNDTYVVDNASDVVEENFNEGADTVEASITYALTANVENLTLTGATAINGTGNELNNTLTGNNGDNRLNGGAGADTMRGGSGNDTYVVDNTADVVTENLNAGTDTVEASITYALTANVENLTLTGTDAINGTGNELNNVIIGNNGDNRLNGGAGADTLRGGLGNDTYVVDNTADVVTENLNEGTDTIEASVTYALSANVENLTLTGTTAINGTGNELNNVIIGNNGDNRLNGGAGADTLRGGLGNDTYVVDNASDVVEENFNEGADTVEASITYALTANVENLTLTGATAINGTGNELNNTLTGNNGDNRLNGGAGADTLVGGDGDDVLNGDDGNDLIFGGAGADTIDGGAGNDTVSYSGSTAAVTVNLSYNTASGGHAQGDVLSNIEHLVGSTHGDTLTGDTGVNRIEGGGGNDTLDGGGGSDTLLGGTGDDTYFLNNTGVTITEILGQGTDVVISSINYTLVDHLENLTLIGSATIGAGNTLNNTLTANNLGNTLSGGDGNDTLIGGTGNDTLNGDVGNDTLRATAGNNTLNGGAGNDSLFAGTGNDTLNGGDGNDTLDLRSHNVSLVGDRADGGAGNDTVVIAQSQLVPSLTLDSNSISGGIDSDTLQFHASAAGQLNLINIFDTNKINALNSFETLDLSKDNIASRAVISSSLIQGLVDNGNNSSLTLVLSKASGAQDTYTIATGENYSIGQNSSNQTVFTFQDAASIQIAQLTISYV